MTIEQKQKQLVQQLKSHYNNDINRVKKLSKGCKGLGFDLKVEAHIDAIAKHPEAFFTLMTFSDFGIIEKIMEVLEILKKTK